ncbi:hypothetical protein DUNSADRAFT_2808 [Dunaliella salina]|nr:hypothetical protein DUNSADRAFT_2808 [Dunaliella salina]|eukprot:KAF5838479.1 hypothetical protein DUNSADRAFT_2808 [Dunaliella salina]
MQRNELLRHHLFGWGFNCVGLGASWDPYEIAIFPSGETTADAYVMRQGWQADLASTDTKRLKADHKLVLILDMDRTILQCAHPSEVRDLRKLFERREAKSMSDGNVLVPRAYLLDIVRMAYGLDRPPEANPTHAQRYELMFCTGAGYSRATRYLELLREILLGKCQDEMEKRCVEDATELWRLTSVHCGGIVWKPKSVQDVVQTSFLTDEGNRMTVIVDDDPDLWDSKDRKQIVNIDPQQGGASHLTPAAFQKSAGLELKDFLCKVHERLTYPGSSWTVAEVLNAVKSEHVYSRLSLCG